MNDYSWIDGAIEQAVTQIRCIAKEASAFPHITHDGAWQYTSDGVWTGGFWTGLLWLAHWHTGADDLHEQAVDFTERLVPRAFDTYNHDLGFMFYPSAVVAGQITGEQRYFDIAKAAATSLARQFNSQGGFIPGWGFFGDEDWAGTVLIDTLMNLPILVWAAQQDGEDWLSDVSERQVSKTLQHFFREDGSVYHTYRFDSTTGQPLGGGTYQGYSAESAWARGQAWAITGLAILAAMTSAKHCLKASEQVAEYFRSQLPDDDIPPWDFKAAGTNQPKDSSAGSIAAYGYLRLFEITSKQEHFDTAVKLLSALASKCANKGLYGGLLLHATADLPHDLGVDGSTMYGDYYYLKSLLKLKSMNKAQ